MTITREVHRGGQEVFVIDTEHLHTTEHCNSCMYARDVYATCVAVQCTANMRSDRRSVYFLPVTDLKGQLLFHTYQTTARET